jgi:two-component sensor histidine kinase
MVLLSPSATQTLGLALHELYDNARKHGALSDGGGVVSLVWRIDALGAEPNFEMTWRECGGPRVKRTRVPGFGSVVLERLTPAGLNASSTLSFAVEGVAWRLMAPLKEVVKSAGGDSRPPPPSGQAASG